MEKLVNIYIQKIRPKVNEEYHFFSEQSSIGNAIRQAALAINCEGKRYSHQRRLSQSILDEAYEILINESVSFVDIGSFEELHSLIERLVINKKGIGPLYVYDTSLRIGAYLGLLPRKIYLHAGTREGARALGLNWRSGFLSISELPSELHDLKPHEIEDFLCIFKGELRNTKLIDDVEYYLERSRGC